MGNIKRNLLDEIMVRLELLVKLHLQELGVDVGEPVVGEDEAGHVLVVLCHRAEAGVRGQVVVGQVQHRGPVGDGGEVGEAAAGAVDKDRVGGGRPRAGARPKVMEDTGAEERAPGVDMA